MRTTCPSALTLAMPSIIAHDGPVGKRIVPNSRFHLSTAMLIAGFCQPCFWPATNNNRLGYDRNVEWLRHNGGPPAHDSLKRWSGARQEWLPLVADQ